MDPFCYPKQKFDFEYIYSQNTDAGVDSKVISHSILLPFDTIQIIREEVYIILKLYNLPEYLEEDLYEKLKIYADNKIDELQNQRLTKLLNNKNKWIENSKKVLHTLTQDHKEEKLKQTDNYIHDDNFYLMYHKIIHSGILTSQLIQLENHNSEVIRNLIKERDEYIQSISEEQNKNIEKILLNHSNSEKEINQIMGSNILFIEKCKNVWEDKIKNVRNDQKREFYTWIKTTYEDILTDQCKQIKELHCSDENLPEEAKYLENKNDFPIFMNDIDEVVMEESYTINLGSQLKTTHNLRLISADILKFCNNLCTTQRIQTAMSLYSNSLSGVILLVDKSLKTFDGIKEDFAKLCLGGSENHFLDFDNQLNLIKSELLKQKQTSPKKDSVELNVGDVYITKHSNLSEVHVVFHIVTDDSIKSPEINSRHPVILGIRNILKIAHIYDICNISIPLLLLHNMTEDITIQWCLRRSELVLKCVKGFMIEMSSLLSLNDNENKTIQFVVPKGISNDLFISLSAIFPNVFRLCNTLFLTTSNS